MKCDDGTWIRGSQCFGIAKKWEDFHHVPVRSSYQLSFYNVFIVCYLLIESLKRKRSPFLPFLRFPLYVLFGQRDISSSWLYRLVWECMSPKPSFQYFSPFLKKEKKFLFFLIAITSKKEEKNSPIPGVYLVYLLRYLVKLYKDCKMFKTNKKYFLHFVMKKTAKKEM